MFVEIQLQGFFDTNYWFKEREVFMTEKIWNKMYVLIRTMMLQYRHGIYFILMRWNRILNHRMNLLYVPLTIITKDI